MTALQAFKEEQTWIQMISLVKLKRFDLGLNSTVATAFRFFEAG